MVVSGERVDFCAEAGESSRTRTYCVVRAQIRNRLPSRKVVNEHRPLLIRVRVHVVESAGDQIFAELDIDMCLHVKT